MNANSYSRATLASGLLWLVPALWALNYIVARRAPGVIGPYALALGRWSLAGALLLLGCAPELWQRRAHLRQYGWQYVVLGFFGMVICGAWVYIGAHSTGAMNISLIYAASPVLIAVGAVCWLGERMRTRQVGGVVLTLIGVLYVISKGDWTALLHLQFTVGDGWIVAATLAWAAYALLQKHWPSPLSATARLCATSWGGVLLLLPCAVWESSQPGALPLTPQGWWLVIVAALAPGVGAYWIYGWAQKILGASRVAVVLYLGPLYGALAAWGLLNEPLGWHHVIGAVLILPGVFLVTSG